MDEHPFLLCHRSQFPDLRARAGREPWATMWVDARDRIENGYDGTDPIPLHRYVGALALGYILEPDRQADHANQVRDAIVEQLSAVTFNPEQAHAGTVPPMGAAFVCILALDIVHDDLAPDDVAACEAVIADQIGKIDREGSWPAARYGTHGTWDIYCGDRTGPDDAFYDNYRCQMTPDGVSTVANTYAFSRLGSSDSRPQKTGYADVLEHTGIDQRYYDNPRFAHFYRWLCGSAVDPSRQLYQFGDAFPYASIESRKSTLLWRVGRFDRTAAAHAAWLLEDYEPPGHLLSYVLMDESLPDPIVPQSRLYPDGGAVFRELPDDPHSLGAGLYNITANDEWHTHEETNAIAVSAYGAKVTVNGGWLGENMRPPWKNNTIAVDGRRHEHRTGAGLVEGWTTDLLDYACGDAGGALGAIDFRRSLLLVHGRGELPGYVPVIDEVSADPGAVIHAYLHPATESPPTAIADRTRYRAAIDHHAPVDGVTLDVGYGTEPTAVDCDEVESGDLERTPDSGHHYRLTTTYPVGSTGTRTLVTVLVPADQSINPPAIERRTGSDYSGVVLDHENGVQDVLVGTASPDPVTVADELTLDGTAMLYRTTDRGTAWYFARNARSVELADCGVESSTPISLFLEDTRGIITTPDRTDLRISRPNVSAIRLGDRLATDAIVEGDVISLSVPPGRHAFTMYVDDSP